MERNLPASECENDQAFKKAFESYYRNLCFFAFQLLQDKALAEDVVQDAFVAFWNQKDNVIDHEKAIRSYLYSTVKFISLNTIRHQKVVGQHELSQANDHFEEEKITEKIIQAEIMKEVYYALDKLPFHCREIFRLGYFEGLSNSKIAETLEISINTVKTQKQRGLKILRSILKPEFFFIFLLIFKS